MPTKGPIRIARAAPSCKLIAPREGCLRRTSYDQVGRCLREPLSQQTHPNILLITPTSRTSLFMGNSARTAIPSLVFNPPRRRRVIHRYQCKRDPHSQRTPGLSPDFGDPGGYACPVVPRGPVFRGFSSPNRRQLALRIRIRACRLFATVVLQQRQPLRMCEAARPLQRDAVGTACVDLFRGEQTPQDGRSLVARRRAARVGQLVARNASLARTTTNSRTAARNQGLSWRGWRPTSRARAGGSAGRRP